MDGLLNEHTQTVHKPQLEATALATECGITRTLDPDRLETVAVEQVTTDDAVSKCGRCFDDGGGY